MNEIVKSANAKLGKNLVKASSEILEIEQRQAIIAETTSLLRSRHQAEKDRERIESCIRFYQNKVDALERGEFTISHLTEKIAYNDEALNATSPKLDY